MSLLTCCVCMHQCLYAETQRQAYPCCVWKHAWLQYVWCTYAEIWGFLGFFFAEHFPSPSTFSSGSPTIFWQRSYLHPRLLRKSRNRTSDCWQGDGKRWRQSQRWQRYIHSFISFSTAANRSLDEARKILSLQNIPYWNSTLSHIRVWQHTTLL